MGGDRLLGRLHSDQRLTDSLAEMPSQDNRRVSVERAKSSVSMLVIYQHAEFFVHGCPVRALVCLSWVFDAFRERWGLRRLLPRSCLRAFRRLMNRSKPARRSRRYSDT